MRHRKTGRKFNRTNSHRKLMLRNIMISLLYHTIIKTTLSKAKELRRIIEPIITLSKVNTISNRRLAFSKLRNSRALNILFNQLGPHFINRPGGYTRILKYGIRTGDHAPMAYIELVDRMLLKDHENCQSSTSVIKLSVKK